jgi:hypothetical protein
MTDKQRVLSLVRAGKDYEEIARQLDVPPGLAYMVATGLPADGSDVLAPDELRREGLLEGSTQHLANPRSEIPKHKESVARWMAARAGADAAMQLAASARTADPPPIEGESDDVVDVLGWDHNQVDYLDKQLKALPKGESAGDPDHQRRVSIVDMIRVRLSQHETAEEEHFWPAVRKHLPDGDSLADQALRQEQEGKDLLQELSKVEEDLERFDELAEKLSKALAKHVAFEDLVLLRFEEAVDDATRRKIGTKVKQAKAKSAASGPPAERAYPIASGE